MRLLSLGNFGVSVFQQRTYVHGGWCGTPKHTRSTLPSVFDAAILSLQLHFWLYFHLWLFSLINSSRPVSWTQHSEEVVLAISKCKSFQSFLKSYVYPTIQQQSHYKSTYARSYIVVNITISFHGKRVSSHLFQCISFPQRLVSLYCAPSEKKLCHASSQKHLIIWVILCNNKQGHKYETGEQREDVLLDGRNFLMRFVVFNLSIDNFSSYSVILFFQ